MNQLNLKKYFSVLIFFAVHSAFGQTVTKVKSFHKVIISPNIEVTFIEGKEESVTIEKSTVSYEKIHIEVNDKTLRVYLDGQKDFPKNEKTYKNGYKEKQSVYKGAVVIATVTYKKLDDLSIRGEETQVCKSLLKGKKFKLKVYGEPHVIFDDVNLDQLQATMYGESSLKIKSGTIKEQKFIAYGESTFNCFAINNATTKITAYGGAVFEINASDAIKITAYGDAKLKYKGNAQLNKGINIGDVQIDKME